MRINVQLEALSVEVLRTIVARSTFNEQCALAYELIAAGTTVSVTKGYETLANAHWAAADADIESAEKVNAFVQELRQS